MKTCVCHDKLGRLCLWHYGQLSPRERAKVRREKGLGR